nr:triple gene block protein 2 [Elm carlavirus]
MPLSPPADKTSVYFASAIGLGIALSLFTLTRSTLPHVGDNIHSLPHGGRYRDGTKSVDYCGPAKRYPSSNLLTSGSSSTAVLFIIVLVGLIWLSDKFGKRGVCNNCNRSHQC